MTRHHTGERRSNAVLITGANGEVGHGLIRALAESGHADIVAIDLRELDASLRPFVREAFVGDICDTFLLGRLLAMYEIDAIYHLAALLSTRAEFNPEAAHEVNVGGTLNLLRLAYEQARSHGRTVKFIYPSSIAVYGLPNTEAKAAAGPVREDAFLSPTTMYGCNKLYGEHLGRYYARHYRQLATDRLEGVLDFRAIRYPGLISPHTLPSGGTSDFAPEMLHAAAQGETYASFVREDARIPFMLMQDAIDATLALGHAEPSRLTRTVYNVAHFAPTAGELADLTRHHFPGAQITFAPDAQRQAIVDSWPADVDCAAAERDWGFTPAARSLQDAFADVLVPQITARYRGETGSTVHA
ncbi:MAG: NAD-dependent epimerase/dehydratase family protein [Planctomycetota bacterium]